jgi:hypothetical protein
MSAATVQQSTRSQAIADVQRIEGENRVLRWGGLAGIGGGLLFILVFVIVGVFAGVDYAGPEAVIRFPEIRAARTVENGLYLLVLILWVPHFLALYRALRATSLAPALFGSVLGILGLGVLAAGALLHVATLPISDLYHAPGASPQDQATLVLIWQATQGIFDALLVAGLVVLPIGLVALGVAMLGTPAFGKGYGWVSVGLGVIGVGAATAVLIDPGFPIAAAGVFALIIFNLVLGWKVYRLPLTVS